MTRTLLWIRLPCLVLVLTLAATSCDEQQQPAQREAPAPTSGSSVASNAATLPAIVFLGDSLTAGRGLEESEAVPALIQRELDDKRWNYRVINGGRSGDTTAGGLSRLGWYLRDSVNLSVLVIGLGSNDAMRGLPLATIESNLRQIIDQARAARPAVRILLWELRTFPNMGVGYGEEYRKVFTRIAQDMNVGLLPFPLQPVAGKPELNQQDGIHPNAAGTRLVAEHIWAHLAPQLEPPRLP